MTETRDVTEVTAAALRRWQVPDPGEDKEARGRVLVVAGSRTTPGAVLLAAEAALRAGAGKLSVVTTESVAEQVAALLPEAQVHGVAETEDGSLDPEAADEILSCADPCDATLLGPGFVDPELSVALLESLVPRLGGTVVIDALASAYVTERPERLAELDTGFVLTLNPNELAHTLGIDEVEDQVAGTAELARRTGAVVLCGGTAKVVADPDGGLWRLDVGGPGLGVSGSGDVQAGIVAGLVARGAEHAQAAVWGGWLHGRSGDRLADRVGTVGFLAREIPAEVPQVLAELTPAD
jgi:hydroxyethylthiazole kinase-like uncharacterized protein yjeF